MEFVFQCEHHSWSFGGEADALGNAYCSRHILLLLWSNRWVEICIPLSLACLHTYIVLNTYTHLYFGKDRANFLFVFLIIPLRSQHARRAKSTKKENLFLKGTWDMSLFYTFKYPFSFGLAVGIQLAVLFTL